MLTIAVAAIMLILCAALGNVMMFETRQSIRQEKRTQAYSVAKSGATAVTKYITTNMNASQDTALAGLAVGATIKTTDNIFEGNKYDIEITKKSSTQLLVKTTGKIENGSSNGNPIYVEDSVTSVLKLDNVPVAINSAVFGINSVKLNQGSGKIYGSIGTSSSSSDAILCYDDFVTKDIYIPVGADPNKVIKRVQAGTNRVNQVDQHYPPFILPTYTVKQSDKTVGNGVNGSIDATNPAKNWYENITLNSGELEIKISGDTELRVKNITLNSGKLKIVGTGTLKLYVENSFITGGAVQINYDEDSNKLFVYSSAASIVIQDKVYFNGLIYAPSSDVTLKGGSLVKGAIIANNVKTDNDPTVTYVPITGGVPITGSSTSKYKQEYWQ